MAKYRNNELLSGNITKTLIRVALPLMFFNLINVLYSFVDTYWVSRLGELQVGAISLISTINLCGSAFVTGLSAAGMALMSRAIGAEDRDKANTIASTLMTVSIVLGIAIGLFCGFFAHPMLKWLKVPQEIYDDAYWYLLGLCGDFVFLFVITIFQSIRQSQGDSRTGVVINTIAAVINCVLDPLMIFGLNWTMFGASLATTLSKALVTPLVFYILYTDRQQIYLDHHRYPFSFTALKQIVSVGLPASVGSFLLEFGFMIMNKYIIDYGSVILSAYGIGNRVTSLFYIPTNGLAAALTPFVGQSIGAGNYQRTQQCYRTAMKVGALVSFVTTVIGFIFTVPLVRFFSSRASEQLISNAIEYSYYSIATTFFMCWLNNLLAMFNGAGETKSSLAINVIRLWGARIPMLYFFKNYTDLGARGIWLAMILSNLVICILGQIWYSIMFRRRYNPKKQMSLQTE